MNLIIDTQSKTITIKESYKLYDVVEELEKRFTKEELKDYTIIPGGSSMVNPWNNLWQNPHKDTTIGPPYNTDNPYKGTFTGDPIIQNPISISNGE